MGADSGIEAHALNDIPSIQPFGFGISIQFVEIGDTHGEIRVGKQLYCFRFRGIGDQDRNVLRLLACSLLLCSCTLKKKIREHLRLFMLRLIGSDYNAARMEVVIESLGFAKEFGAENDVVDVIF